MRSSNIAGRRGPARVWTTIVTTAALLLTSAIYAPSADAHHPEIRIDDLGCDGHVWFTATAWQTDDLRRRVNNEIGIYYQTKTGDTTSGWTRVPDTGDAFHFDANNRFTFSGHLDLDPVPDAVKIRARAEVKWGPNEDLNGVGDDSQRTTDWHHVPDCVHIFGYKWHDLDADGVWDDGEPALKDWEIRLAGTDKFDRSVNKRVRTDSDGKYRFDVNPGRYTICEIIPAGWFQSYPNTDVACDHGTGHHAASREYGDRIGPKNFGNYQQAGKLGVKFEDLDGDGRKDDGEPGVRGVTIHAFGADDFHETTQTGSDGSYAFRLRPGGYLICEDPPQPWVQTAPKEGAACENGTKGYRIRLASGEVDRDNDFGNVRPTGIGGVKFHDLDADGRRDEGEPGLEGWTILLTGIDGMGNPVADQISTDDHGRYAFTGLMPGIYKVCEDIPDGWHQSYPSTGPSCDDGKGHHVELLSGQGARGRDFGNFQGAGKTGTKFEDVDGDGVRDDDEPGVPGVTIHIFGRNDFHETNVTNQNGVYGFRLRPGTYVVCEELPGGWVQTYPTEGPGEGTPCEEFGTIGYRVVVESGEVDRGNDFGNVRPTGIGGLKFEDLDGDGERDEGEPTVAGVPILLDGVDNRGNLVSDSTVTDEDGFYAFTGLLPGTYTVCEDPPAGWTQSYPTDGPDCEVGIGHEVEILSGQGARFRDFGNWRAAETGGIKFNDLNRNGARDEGEPTIAGWPVGLTGTSGSGAAVEEETVTDEDGSYSFSVPPGSYLICEDTRATELWVQSHPAAGADCSADGGGVGYEVSLISNEVDVVARDFGNFLLQPDITLDKTVDPVSGSPGDTVTYTYLVTNTGEVELFDVLVTDDILGTIGTIPSLEAGASAVLTQDAVLGDAAVTNVGTASGTDAIGRTVSDDDPASVTVVLGAVIDRPGPLPRTGTDPGPIGRFGVMILLAGLALRLVGRRRRHAVESTR